MDDTPQQSFDFDYSSPEYIRAKDHYESRRAATRDLSDLNNPDNGFSEEEKEQYFADNPLVAEELVTRKAIEATIRESRGVLNILRSGNTSLIPHYASKIVEQLSTRLGRQPDAFDAHIFTISHAVNVALQTRTFTSKVIADDIESQICEGVAAQLVEQGDLSLLVSEAIGYNDENCEAEVESYLEIINPILQANNIVPIEKTYVLAKLSYLHKGPIRQISSWLNVKKIEHAHTPEITKMRGEQNTVFAQRMRAIRHYGVKPMIFDFSSVTPGLDNVIEDPNEIIKLAGYDNVRVPDIALMRLTDERVDPKSKFTPNILPTKAGLNTIGYEGLVAIIYVDKNGELRSGGARDFGNVSLKRVFEKIGKSNIYEDMRAQALVQVFDSIAPATLVAKQQNEVVSPAPEYKTGDPSDVVYEMMLPRMRTLEGHQKQVRALFDEFIAEEQQAIERHFRLHEVTSHLRRIPENARPSQDSIAESKRVFGDDYELPEGYTFVRSHERGDISRGRVVGHTALPLVVSQVN